MTLESIKDSRDLVLRQISLLQLSLQHLEAEEKELLKAQQAQQPKLERWKPVNLQRYFVVYDEGYPAVSTWGNDEADVKRHDFFNCFPTEEEAQKEALRTRARRKLEWLARELNAKAALTPDGFIIYPCKGKVVISGCTLSALQLGAVFFYNKTDAEYALSQMTSEELEALR